MGYLTTSTTQYTTARKVKTAAARDIGIVSFLFWFCMKFFLMCFYCCFLRRCDYVGRQIIIYASYVLYFFINFVFFFVLFCFKDEFKEIIALARSKQKTTKKKRIVIDSGANSISNFFTKPN